MSGLTLLICAAGYFALLLLLSHFTSKSHDNEAFFRANKNSPWWAVAYGMIGASVSGVSFVSVPGMVENSSMYYVQMCIGFVFGYALVAFILLPVYYRMNPTSIYTYLNNRFGRVPYLTGATFFFFSKLIGASIRLFLVASILQTLIFDQYGIPFWLNTAMLLFAIWIYTRRSGIRTIVWSDCLQTTVLLISLTLIIWQLCVQMEWGIGDLTREVLHNPMSDSFVFNDHNHRYYFWKQFFGGIFVIVVMTGIDQDSMQKNLTCRTLRKSQLNMCVNGLFYLPVNVLFLFLGAALVLFKQKMGIDIPAGDSLMPTLCGEGYLGNAALIYFAIGIIAAAFSSADSALASLTTTVCVDIFQRPKDETLRKWIHPLIAVLFWIFIMGVKAMNSTSVIDVVYTVCGYTFGPLLGLFAFGLLTKRQPASRWVPYICLASPLISYAADWFGQNYTSYKFGYELLIFNGLFTFVGLWASSTKLGTNNTGGNGHV